MDELEALRKVRTLDSGGWRVVIDGDTAGDWFQMRSDSLEIVSLPLGSLAECEAFKNGAIAANRIEKD